VGKADAGISEIAENDPGDGAGGNHLVEQDIGSGPRDGEGADAPAQDLMGGGERHQMAEPADEHGVAVVDVAGDGLGESGALDQMTPSSR
jgi:hypothetical protein